MSKTLSGFVLVFGLLITVGSIGLFSAADIPNDDQYFLFRNVTIGLAASGLIAFFVGALRFSRG